MVFATSPSFTAPGNKSGIVHAQSNLTSKRLSMKTPITNIKAPTPTHQNFTIHLLFRIWLGRVDSNHDYRIQNPVSCPLDDAPVSVYILSEKELIINGVFV